MKKTWTIAILAAVMALTLAACGGGDEGGDDGDGGGATTTATDAPDGDDDGAGTELTVTAPAGASNSGFAETSLSAPADTAFTIVFDNQDGGIPHNVQIFEGDDTAAEPIWAPEGDALITGPDTVTYEIPALPAGTYTFNCLSHPTTMVGTLTVG